MNNPLQIQIAIEWAELPSDGSRCEVCKEVIEGKMFQVVIFVNYEPSYKPEKVCEGCYSLKDSE